MPDIVQYPLEQIAATLSTHALLSASDRAALLNLHSAVRTWRTGEYLIEEGDAPDLCGVLIAGFVWAHKTGSNGERQVVSLYVPGDMLNLQHFHLNVADHSVQSLTDCRVATVPRLDLQALARERPAINHAIFVTALIESASFREWLLNVGRRNARARVAHLLCEVAVRIGGLRQLPGQSYCLPFTQEQLGDALGLSAIHINRTMSSLKAEGLITQKGRMIGFPSWDAIRRMSQFDSQYLHLSQNSI